MSTLGIIMLVHTELDRAEQVARHWAASGCPVVIHVDRKVNVRAHSNFVAACADAKAKAEAYAAEEMKKVTGDLPLPPGMKLF